MIRLRLLRSVCCPVVLAFIAFGLPGQEPAAQGEDREEERVLDQHEDWEETLRFGIDSEIVELLDELAEQQVEELADDVLDLLRERSNPRLLRNGLSYFSAIDDPRAEEVATELLSDRELSDVDVAIEALRYLADGVDSADPETLVTVRGLLTVQSEQIAAQAASTLGSLDDTDGLEEMRRAFEQRREENVRRNILLGVGKMGDKAREAQEWILPLLGNPQASETVQQYAIDTLGRIGAEEAREPLKELLESDSSMMRAYAISSLVMLDASGITDELTRAMRDDDWRVRQIAVEGVGEAEYDESLFAARYMARRDPDHRVATSAVRTIGSFESDEAYEVLREIVSERSAPIQARLAAVDILIENDLADSVDTLVEILEKDSQTGEEQIIQQIASGLSGAEHQGLSEAFRILLEHEEVTMRLLAIQGIGRNGFDEFKEEIEDFTADRHPASVRRYAEEALENL